MLPVYSSPDVRCLRRGFRVEWFGKACSVASAENIVAPVLDYDEMGYLRVVNMSR